MLSAVQLYNNPQVTFKSEAFITLAIIGWTYLFHAYYRSKNIDYRYYSSKGKRKTYNKTKYGAYRRWDLTRCLNDTECPLDPATKSNLEFLIGIRHEIEHQMTNKIDEYMSAKLQACAINFDYYICRLFGEKYNLSNELSLAIQFSPLSPEQQKNLRDNDHITTNVKNFIVAFEDVLSDKVIQSSKYAYRYLFSPITVNRRGQADRVVEFIPSTSPMAKNMEKAYAVIKETEKKKYLPGDIVKMMEAKGFSKFTMYTHTKLWKALDGKNKKYNYGVCIAQKWYWYETWVKKVEEYCEEHKDKLM